jgi:nucleoside-diphosphate-sugar epimerase
VDELTPLASQVEAILHCAADTRFDRPLESARAANVVLTRQMLDFARRCPRLRVFLHVSTVYVAGRTAGRIPETLLPLPKQFSNTYQQSKYEAELAVAEAMRDIPAAIARISSIIGDSRTGRVRQFNYVHQLLRLFPRNALTVAPWEPDAPVDLVPADWVASHLARLLAGEVEPRRVYHLCCGDAASMTVRDMVALTRRLFDSHPSARTRPPVRLPKLVTLAEFESFCEQMRAQGSHLTTELLRALGLFLPHLGIYQLFENQRTSLMPPPAAKTYETVVRWCLDTDWGRCSQASSSSGNPSM